MVKIGDVYGSLTVISSTYSKTRNGSSQHRWVCRCECGTIVARRVTHLKHKNPSCGCKRRKNIKTESGSHKHPQDASVNALISRMFHNAKTRGLEWELTKEQAMVLVFQDCYYCGDHPSQIYTPYASKRSGKYMTGVSEERVKNSTIKYNGIDRVDNSLGYTPLNCRPCCFTCNRAKGGMTESDFLAWVARIKSKLNL